MPKNTLVINCDIRETRVALIEGGVIAELQIERAAARGTVGNVVLGKVTRVLPGMQAAFIDVGQERAAFLHVEDLIRPADFDAYLSGDAREDKEALKVPDAGGPPEAAPVATMKGPPPKAAPAPRVVEPAAPIAAEAAAAEVVGEEEADGEDDDDELALPSAASRIDRDAHELYDDSDIE